MRINTENLVLNNESLSPRDQAQEHYKKAIALIEEFDGPISPNDPAWAAMLQETKDNLTQAIELDPTYPGYYIVLANVNLFRFDKDAAIENCSKAIELNPDFSDEDCPQGLAYFTRGIAYSFKGTKEAFALALADLEKAANYGFAEAQAFIEQIKIIISAFEMKDPQKTELLQAELMEETTAVLHKLRT